MIDIWETGIQNGVLHAKNTIKGIPDNTMPCICCGKPVKHPFKHSVRLFYGNEVVTQSEADALIAAGEEGGDLGHYPVGTDCLRKNPALRPYVADAAFSIKESSDE